MLISFASIFFSYLGNTASLKALERAPNAGYSLVIQKSYAIYTSIVAVILFSSQLSIDKYAVIFISILLLFLVSHKDKSKTQDKKHNWVMYSIVAFFLFGNLSLFSKFMLQNGYEPLQLTFYVFLINVIIQSFTNRKVLYRELSGVAKNKWIILCIIGVHQLSLTCSCDWRSIQRQIWAMLTH